ncbi:MAG: sulfate reduction electron transfer complex DsrMKJOP subunit DsrM [Spirochaetes bacterium]|nr:sulfate reduction electron transfer complex DsrMKJOP subunit DsrM [Spirochaetota bacterium]
MRIIFSSIAVSALCAAAYILGALAPTAAGIVVPYGAAVFFITGIIYRTARWLASPVPFRIPVTAGQEKSLSWIEHRRVDNPDGPLGTALRMLSEVLLFRSLFRNTALGRSGEGLPVYGSGKWLWLGAMAFHWSLLYIVVRHLRFFMEPVPAFADLMAAADDIFRIGNPGIYITNIVIAAALAYLLLRRMALRDLRRLSLFQDYALPLLIAAVAATGMLQRYVWRTDLLGAKEYAMGLVTLRPALPAGAGPLFYMHLVLASALMAVIPHSKIAHAVGVLLSPTRNMANSNRRKRHVNPWNAPVKVHSYEEWEEEFRDKIVKAGYALERDNGGEV